MTPIDRAREMILRHLTSPSQYKDYVNNKLAGDFACELAAALEVAEKARWLPISEAPKDGTPFLAVLEGLVFYPEVEVCHGSGCFYSASSREVEIKRGVRLCSFILGKKEVTLVSDDGHELSGENLEAFKLCQPLPAPPINKDEACWNEFANSGMRSPEESDLLGGETDCKDLPTPPEEKE